MKVHRRLWGLIASSWLVCLGAATPTLVSALGEGTRVAILGVDAGGLDEPRPMARRRLAWEVRKRTSIETALQPDRARLDDPRIFESPFLYWSGDRAFPPLSEGEVVGLRRFLELGGFLFVDDASPDAPGFDASVRRELARALPRDRLRPLPRDHTIFRSFFLVSRPVGRVRGPTELEGVTLGDRLAVVLSRHDVGGALARDNLGNWQHPVTPGGDAQRELATRLAVNLVMYALCLDYKDDQVHAPFIMRRRGAGP
ncbi:MAG: DUF4159 domain-containing protein [Myxococcales bacterium]|nr:DUF4159 domain-containing protein [Myxococcales bacterium]